MNDRAVLREALAVGRTLSATGDAFKTHGKILALGALLFFGLSVLSQGMLIGVQAGMKLSSLSSEVRALLRTLVIVLFFGNLLLQQWLEVGIIRASALAISRKEVRPRVFVSGADRLVALVGYRLLVVAALLVPLALLVLIPAAMAVFHFTASPNYQAPHGVMVAWIILVVAVLLAAFAVVAFAYIALGAIFGDFIVVLDRVGPVRAFRTSFDMIRGNRIRLLWLFIALTFVALLGALSGLVLLVVGVLFTLPLAMIFMKVALVDAFLYARGNHPARQIAAAPPPSALPALEPEQNATRLP